MKRQRGPDAEMSRREMIHEQQLEEARQKLDALHNAARENETQWKEYVRQMEAAHAGQLRQAQADLAEMSARYEQLQGQRETIITAITGAEQERVRVLAAAQTQADALTEQARSQAQTLLSDARGQAEELQKTAQLQAAEILRNAHTEAGRLVAEGRARQQTALEQAAQAQQLTDQERGMLLTLRADARERIVRARAALSEAIADALAALGDAVQRYDGLLAPLMPVQAAIHALVAAESGQASDDTGTPAAQYPQPGHCQPPGGQKTLTEEHPAAPTWGLGGNAPWLRPWANVSAPETQAVHEAAAPLRHQPCAAQTQPLPAIADAPKQMVASTGNVSSPLASPEIPEATLACGKPAADTTEEALTAPTAAEETDGPEELLTAPTAVAAEDACVLADQEQAAPSDDTESPVPPPAEAVRQSPPASTEDGQTFPACCPALGSPADAVQWAESMPESLSRFGIGVHVPLLPESAWRQTGSYVQALSSPLTEIAFSSPDAAPAPAQSTLTTAGLSAIHMEIPPLPPIAQSIPGLPEKGLPQGGCPGTPAPELPLAEATLPKESHPASPLIEKPSGAPQATAPPPPALENQASGRPLPVSAPAVTMPPAPALSKKEQRRLAKQQRQFNKKSPAPVPLRAFPAPQPPAADTLPSELRESLRQLQERINREGTDEVLRDVVDQL